MTCTCNCLSPFRWREYPQPSIFTGRAFTIDDSTLQANANRRHEAETGRSRGSIQGISQAGDELCREFGSQKQAKRRSASHYKR